MREHKNKAEASIASAMAAVQLENVRAAKKTQTGNFIFKTDALAAKEVEAFASPRKTNKRKNQVGEAEDYVELDATGNATTILVTPAALKTLRVEATSALRNANRYLPRKSLINVFKEPQGPERFKPNASRIEALVRRKM